MKNEMIKRLGKGMTEAIERKCEIEKMSLFAFFMDFVEDYADDEFFDMMGELCDKYGIAYYDEEADCII